jgi:hypothetical protein
MFLQIVKRRQVYLVTQVDQRFNQQSDDAKTYLVPVEIEGKSEVHLVKTNGKALG